MATRQPVIAAVADDADFLELARAILESRYHVVCYGEPVSALAGMREQPPDLVVTDLMMTSLDSGFVLSRQLKEDPALKTVPVIVVTAVASQRGFDFRPQSAEDLKAMRVEAYLEKPVSPKLLLRKVEELLLKRTGAGA